MTTQNEQDAPVPSMSDDAGAMSAPQETHPPVLQETSLPALQEASPPARQEIASPARQETVSPARQETSPPPSRKSGAPRRVKPFSAHSITEVGTFVSQRVGVFVDAENIRYNGGYQMRYDVLRRFAARENVVLQRLNTYLAFDSERAREDFEYAKKSRAYQQMVRDFGWKITVKTVRRYTDESGNVSTKANADLDMAVDAMLQAGKLDQVILVTGDGDFLQVVTALQNMGCRVELIGFKNVSRQLQQEVDAFWSGYLIPDLLPIAYEPRNDWGKPESCVRGVCTKWFPDKGYGFLRFMNRISPDLWITDPREPGSPYTSVFCHANEVAEDVTEEMLLNRETILEFYLKESDQKDNGLVANNVRLAFAINR